MLRLGWPFLYLSTVQILNKLGRFDESKTKCLVSKRPNFQVSKQQFANS
jgi:hypothetical protein